MGIIIGIIIYFFIGSVTCLVITRYMTKKQTITLQELIAKSANKNNAVPFIWPVIIPCGLVYLFIIKILKPFVWDKIKDLEV
jgi:hypothetical protein